MTWLRKVRTPESDNARNGHKLKRVHSSYGNFNMEVLQDRKSTFELQIVPKRQRDISDIDRKISSQASGLCHSGNKF
ncbi:MAG: transposase [Selenomonadaceae bacterium]|nr:transposase [Selenomonadaceae bacterium]